MLGLSAALGSSSFDLDGEVHLLIPWDGHAQGKMALDLSLILTDLFTVSQNY